MRKCAINKQKKKKTLHKMFYVYTQMVLCTIQNI